MNNELESKFLNEYKTLRIIKETEKQKINIIQIRNKVLVLKESKSFKSIETQMLRNEAKALTKLRDCKYIPQIVYYKFDKDTNCLVTKYIDSNNLAYINKSIKLKITEKILIFIKILDIVEEIHKNNIIHCDLKPGNIVIDKENNIYIVDFGICSIDNENKFNNYGTIKYCSIEQLNKQNLTVKTDLYSLGIIFYEMIFKELPFEGEKTEIIYKKNNYIYKKSNDQDLNNIFDRLFSYDKEEALYKNITELKRDTLKLLNKYK